MVVVIVQCSSGALPRPPLPLPFLFVLFLLLSLVWRMVIQSHKMSSFGEVKPVGPDKRVSRSILSLVKVSHMSSPKTTLYTVYKGLLW